VRRAKAGEEDYRLADSGGLYLIVRSSGSKLWRWKYRFNRREKLMTFGAYPEVSLAEAREHHAAGRKLLASGVDPMEERKANRYSQEGSFKEVAAKWMKNWRADKSEKSVSITEQRLNDYVYPQLGHMGLDTIDATHLVRMVKPIDEKGKGETARRVLEVVGQIFRYAIAHGLAKRNPVSDIKPKDVLKPLASKNHARIDASNLPKLLRDIEVYSGRVVTRLAMKLMVLTWPRTKELIGGKWKEVNFELRRWDIPEERTKEGRPHIIPLSTQAIEVLELLHSITGNGELMFPGEFNPRQTMSKNTILEALYRMGYGGEMTGHGFRGVASTILHEQGFEHDHIEVQLSHLVGNQVSAAYNYALYLRQRAEMMQHWGDFLEQTRRSGKVVEFHVTPPAPVRSSRSPSR
jgi:integrase